MGRIYTGFEKSPRERRKGHFRKAVQKLPILPTQNFFSENWRCIIAQSKWNTRAASRNVDDIVAAPAATGSLCSDGLFRCSAKSLKIETLFFVTALFRRKTFSPPIL